MSVGSRYPQSSSGFPFQVLQFSLFAALALLPTLTGSVWLWQLSLASALASGAVLFYWIHRLQSVPGAVLATPMDKWIALYGAALLLSAVFSRIPHLSLIEVYKSICILGLFWAVLYYAKDRARIIRLTQAILFMGASLSVVGLLQFLGGLPKDWWHRSYFMSSMYVNHNHFAGFLVLALPVSLGLALAERDNSKKILYLFLCVIMGTAFVFTLSRGGLAALTASLLFLVIVLKRYGLIRSSTVPFILFVILIVGAVTILGVGPIEQRIENIQNMTQEEELSLHYRLLTWSGALKMIPAHFLVGSGPGTFGNVFLRFRPEGFSQRPVHAHNDYLELLADGGVLLFLSAAMLFIVFFRKGFEIIGRDDSRLRTGLGGGILAAMVGILTHGLFDFNFHINANWAYTAVVAGLLFSLDKPGPPVSSLHLRSLKAAQPICFVLVILGAFWLGTADYAFWEAKEVMKAGGRGNALPILGRSLGSFPWNAEAYYLKGFLRNSADRRKGETANVESVRASVQDFDRAIQLNPYEPYYDFHKARVQAPILGVAAPRDLLLLYHKAMRKDPNNPQLAFACAKDLLQYDKKRDPLLRAAAETILKRVIELSPEHAFGAYTLLWEHDRNVHRILAFYETVPSGLKGLVEFLAKQDLWKYHRKHYVKLLGIPLEANHKKMQQTAWNEKAAERRTLNDFTSPAFDPIHFDEFFHTSGELTRKVSFRNPLKRLVIHAKSSASFGTYPIVAVKVDGQVRDVHYMDSKIYKNYFSLLEAPEGEHLLTLEYMNDNKDTKGTGEDRNVWISWVELQEPL